MSKTYQKSTEYLTQNPNDVTVTALNTIAAGYGIQPFQLCKFVQALGYDGFKDL